MLNIAVRGAASNDAQFLSIQIGIPSVPELNELFSDVKFEKTVSILINRKVVDKIDLLYKDELLNIVRHRRIRS